MNHKEQGPVPRWPGECRISRDDVSPLRLELFPFVIRHSYKLDLEVRRSAFGFTSPSLASRSFLLFLLHHRRERLNDVDLDG
jgi:hypothetical protein